MSLSPAGGAGSAEKRERSVVLSIRDGGSETSLPAPRRMRTMSSRERPALSHCKAEV